VLVTSPIKKLPFKGAFHFDEGFYYFRNLGNRVLLGGARNKAPEAEQTDEQVTTTLIQNELETLSPRKRCSPGRRLPSSTAERYHGAGQRQNAHH